MISPLDVSVLDLNSEELGIPTTDLMRRAGESLAANIHDENRFQSVLIFAGTGNNGGDSIVAAGKLSELGDSVKLILISGISGLRSVLSRNAFRELPPEVEVLDFSEIQRNGSSDELVKEADVVVDGLLGSGAKGKPRGDFAKAVQVINKGKRVFSVDIPTGIGCELHVNADTTVTFHDVKSTMVGKDGRIRSECGDVVTADIGIPAAASRLVGKGDLLRIPTTPPDSHKGESGKVLVIGGGPFTGAPVLSSLAAMAMGCDLVRTAVPEGIWQVVAGSSPCMMVQRLGTEDPFKLGPEVIDELIPSIEWADSVLIGPGSGRDQDTLEFLRDVIDTSIGNGKKVVIDADGITAVSRRTADWPPIESDRVLLTPHGNELRGILDGAGIGFDEDLMDNPLEEEDGIEVWKDLSLDPPVRFSRSTGATVLVKGRIDMIMTPHDHSLGKHIDHHPVHIRYNRTGVSRMSVGGTGDILAGLCAGSMSRGMGAFDSACISAYINGKAGESAHERVGFSLKATDILEHIPIVMRQLSSGS